MTVCGGSHERTKLRAKKLAPFQRQPDRAKAEAAYISDLEARYQVETAKLDSVTGLAELEERLANRQRAAATMFPSTANPLPRMQHVPPIFEPTRARGQQP